MSEEKETYSCGRKGEKPCVAVFDTKEAAEWYATQEYAIAAEAEAWLNPFVVVQIADGKWVVALS